LELSRPSKAAAAQLRGCRADSDDDRIAVDRERSWFLFCKLRFLANCDCTRLAKSARKNKMGKATFAAGCFWGVEAAFRQVKGVLATTVGYSGGTFKNPTYEDVCSGKTAHAEVVQVEYDPLQVSYKDLLDVFWNCHDPTQLNRQGQDVGTQYRSVIFFHTPEQEAAAIASKEELQATAKYRNREIVTAITPASQFYRAEEYHQQYLEKRGQSSCHFR